MLIQIDHQHFLKLVSYFSPTNLDYAKFLTYNHKITIPEQVHNSLKENEHSYATTKDDFNYHFVMDGDWMNDPRNVYNYYDMMEYKSSISDILYYIFWSYQLENDIRSDFYSTIEEIQHATPISFCNCILDFLQVCGSPIERKYLLSMIRNAYNRNYGLILQNRKLGSLSIKTGNPLIKIEIQKLLQRLTVDFFVTIEASTHIRERNSNKNLGQSSGYSSVVVECQGKKYHYDNSGQINETNSRLIDLQSNYPVLPFSGNIINYNSNYCIEKTINFLLNQINRDVQKTLRSKKSSLFH